MSALALPRPRGLDIARGLGGPLLIRDDPRDDDPAAAAVPARSAVHVQHRSSLMVLLTAMYHVKAARVRDLPDRAARHDAAAALAERRVDARRAARRTTGADAAGKVIESFGHFVVGGNYAVGVVVFVILVDHQLRGRSRRAPAASRKCRARFTLDAMPGKQMAIDADLNAGLITRGRGAQAPRASRAGSRLLRRDGRRQQVRARRCDRRHPHLSINIIGGLVIGMFQHGMRVGEAAKNYTLLTIGDGLVAQIPALIISTAAGLVVSRVGTEENMGEQLASQIFAKPHAYTITAGIIGALGLVPGMPHFAFVALAGLLGTGAYYLRKRRDTPRPESATPAPTAPAESAEVTWQDVVPVDVLGLEVGYRLVPLVDRGQDGELLRRIKAIRKKFAHDIGFLPPSIHIRDNLELRPAVYRILLKGVEIAHSEAHAGMYLAINPGRVASQVPGIATTDPAFGLPAVWIEAASREAAQNAGYTVVDASTVVATHLSQLMNAHASELFGREPLQQLIDHLTRETPKLIEDLVPKLLTMPVAAEGSAEPARGRGPYPRHAHDRRSARRPRRAHAGSDGAHCTGPHRPRTRHRAADVPGRERSPGDGALIRRSSACCCRRPRAIRR